jgi:hypothetical protein
MCEELKKKVTLALSIGMEHGIPRLSTPPIESDGNYVQLFAIFCSFSFHFIEMGMQVSIFTSYEFASSLIFGFKTFKHANSTSRAEKSRVARIVAIRLVLVFRVLAGNLRI